MPASAPSVTEEVGTAPAVTGGGVIPVGSYVLTKRIIASGTPKTFKEVDNYVGTCVQTLSVDGSGEQRANATFSSSGSDGTISVTCPVTLSLALTYRVDTTGAKAKLFTRSDTPKVVYNEFIQQ